MRALTRLRATRTTGPAGGATLRAVTVRAGLVRAVAVVALALAMAGTATPVAPAAPRAAAAPPPPAPMAVIRCSTVPTNAACDTPYCLAPLTRISGTTAITVAASTMMPASVICR